MKSDTKPTPDMPLLAFGREIYMSQPHHNSGKLATRQTSYKIGNLCAELSAMLGRIPVVADLTLENCGRLTEHLAAGNSAKVVNFMASMFKAMLRHAAELELVELPDVLLPQSANGDFNHTGAGDTLWVLAQKQLFPRRTNLGPETQRQYRYAFVDFGRFLGHDPVLTDLDDDILVAWQKHLLTRKKSTGQPMSKYTINEKIGRVRTLWTFLAQRRLVEKFPTVLRVKAPDPVPTAFSAEELRKLFQAADEMPGRMGGVMARHWWQALLAFVWSTGERKGATLAMRWEWIDFKNKKIIIPAHVRKGRQKNGVYSLWPEVAVLLERIKEPKRELVFPFDREETMYWKLWNNLLKLAGLSGGAKRKTQALRVSHASWLQALGGDPTAALMHGDSATTIKHYLDPRLLPEKERLLFIPWGDVPAAEPAKPKAKRKPKAPTIAADDISDVISIKSPGRPDRKLPRAKLIG